MKLSFLGTGNATATKCYNTCFLLEADGDFLLVDAGGGNTILSRLEAAGSSWRDVRHIFVTHKHIDHLLGMVWLMRMILQNAARGNCEGVVCMYSHGEVIALLRQLAKLLFKPKELAGLDKCLRLVSLADGDQLKLLGADFTFFDLHSPKDTQFGFELRLADGRRLCCLGDEPCREAVQSHAEGADWLLHEAFCLHAQAAQFKPYEKNHSTARDAAELAERLGVRHLILYHTEDSQLEQRKALYTAEARSCFSGKITVPEDLESMEL